MTVVAKFFVQSVDAQYESQPTARTVKLGAVSRGVENAMWAQYTPSGSIEMGVLNDAAVDYFEPGAEYLVTFQRVAKPEPHDGHPLLAIPGKHGGLLCETCGLYPTWPTGYDGEPDWSQHDTLYGPERS